MAKTIELQIEKSKNLQSGLLRNLKEVQKYGVTSDDLRTMEADIEALSAANEECDRLRAELAAKVKSMNRTLAVVKEQFQVKKRVIKLNFPQEQWHVFGVQDKR
ncbi:MAG: hypothetical protein IJR71_04395 [Prevotella sp.]|nr:hypothetical protein [Prevotella sp.]